MHTTIGKKEKQMAHTPDEIFRTRILRAKNIPSAIIAAIPGVATRPVSYTGGMCEKVVGK